MPCMLGIKRSAKRVEVTREARLQISVVLVREWEVRGLFHLVFVFGEKLSVNFDGWGCESWCGYKFQTRVSDQLSGQPEEWFLEVVIRFCRNVIVLQILFSVECDRFCFDLALLNVDFVTGEYNGDVFADANKVTVPVGNILVGDTGGHIEHDHSALAVDVVSITQTAEFLLAGRVPDIKLDLSQVGCEFQWVDLNTESRNVLLFKFSSQMALDKGSLSSSSIADKDELECRSLLLRLLSHFESGNEYFWWLWLWK